MWGMLGELRPHELLAQAILLLLVAALAPSALARTHRSPGVAARTRQEDEIATRSDADDDALPAAEAATEDCSRCPVAGRLQRLMLAVGDASPASRLSHIADSLARLSCQLVGASAAWVCRFDDTGRPAGLVSTYILPDARQAEEPPTGHARRLAERVAFTHVREGDRTGRYPRLFTEGQFTAAPLVCLGRICGVLVVHGGGDGEGLSRLEQDLLLSLVGHAAVALDNALLNELQRDTTAKLRQFEAHRSNYVATVAHELRTPLTSIKGFAQLLVREEVSVDAAKRYASTIAAEADKLARIVRDIVDLTRMETNLLQLRPQPICIGQLMSDVVRTMQPAGSQPERIRLSLPEALPTVRGDPERMRQVLATLVADAIGRSRADTPVGITAAPSADGVEVRIEFHACAHRVERLAAALEKLDRCPHDGEATQLGRGDLDLYICKNLIEAHGGRMWLEHPAGEMAAVVFTLPR